VQPRNESRCGAVKQYLKESSRLKTGPKKCSNQQLLVAAKIVYEGGRPLGGINLRQFLSLHALRTSSACVALLIACNVWAAVAIVPPNLAGATAGSLSGSLSVSPSGSATFSVPLPVPPGTAAVAPAVGLSYDSHGDAGMLGLGWSLSGQSRITRCSLIRAIDGVRRPVKLDAQDAFCLDGQRLILKTGTTTEYRTEIDSLGRITAIGGDGTNGPASWKIEAKTGQVLYYGSTTDSTFLAPGKAVRLTWALSRTEDRYLNYVSYSYANDSATGEFYLTRIRYTGNDAASPVLAAYNAINFIYEARPDPWMGYMMGSKLQRLKRLTTIQVRINTAADGSAGTLKRQLKIAYTVSGTSGRSLVQSVSDCDGAGTCLPATTFGYTVRNTAANTFRAAGSGDWGGPAVTFNADEQKYGNEWRQLPTKVLAVDLNGDGKSDLLYSEGNGVWKACLSTGTSFSCSNWAGGPANGSSEHVAAGDFNGDGKTDIAMPPTISGVAVDWQLCLSTGSAFNCSTVQAKNWYSGAREPRAYAPRDINWDGRDDLFFQGNDYKGTGSYVCLSTGTGFEPCTPYSSLNVYYPDSETALVYYREYHASGDMDGDGRSDAVNFVEQLSQGDYYTYLARDTSFHRVVRTTHSVAPSLLAGQGISLIADSNGDGYADIHNGTHSQSEICYSKGDESAYDCVITSQTDVDLALVDSVVDYDLDGRPDARSGNTISQIQPTGGRDRAVAWTAPLIVSSTMLAADFNGDGLPDRADYSLTTKRWTVSLTGSASYPDLLNKVTNGYGHDTVVEYKGLHDSSVYTLGSGVSWPKRNQTLGAPVVSKLSSEAVSGEAANQWVDTSYTYAGLRSDMEGRGSLGFGKVNSFEETTSANGSPATITTTTSYSQDFPTVGMPLSVVTKHSGGTILSQTTNTLASFATVPGAYYSYVRLSTVDRKDLDGTVLPKSVTRVGSSGSSTDGIDLYGNVTKLQETVTDGADTFTTVTDIVFSNAEANWLLGLRGSATITKTAPSVTAVTRLVTSVFNGKGHVTSETVEPNTTALKLETVYDVDASFGLVKKKTLKWYDPQSATTKTRDTETQVYDTKFRYPETVTNAKNQSETRTYDPATGNLLTVKGPNLLTTSWAYDGWGRKTREDRADGTATTWAYKKCIDTCGYGSTAVAVTVTQEWADIAGVDEQTTAPTETFFDALGRQVMSRTWNYRAEQVFVDNVFDSLGRLRMVSRVQTGADRSTDHFGWGLYTRDDLGRPTKIETTNQTGNGYDATTVVYAGQSTTTTNPKSQTRKEVLNGLGKLKSVTDAASKTTSHLYDPWGNLKRTTDPLGNQIQIAYDTLGRKTQLDDPDLGVWTYKVNPLGQTYEQTDAKLQKTTFTFDELGRMVDRVEPDQQSHWVYDTAAKGVGKLAEAYTGPSTAKDFQRIHSYDSLGRPAKVITRLDWDYSTLYGYDTYGRVNSQTHRRNTVGATGGTSDQTYNLSYNNQGAVYQVKRDTTLMWTRNSQDALGRNTKETFASGLVTQRDFNDWTGRLSAIETGSVDANGVFTPSFQDDTYTYDSLGNVLTRSQLVAKGGATLTDTFTYDTLNRLWTTKAGAGGVETMAYDELGNVTTKPHVGTYGYAASGPSSVRPHAVASITGAIAGLTNPSFTYDNNGNLKLGLNRAYQWSAANYPVKIDELTTGLLASAKERTEFTYGPDRDRTKQIVRAMTGQTEGAVKRTIFYADAIEKEIDVAQGKTFIRSYLPEGLGYTQETFNSVNPGPGTLADGTVTRYFHKDHLGSPTVITDHAGVEQQRMSYDAWGRRRNPNGVNESWGTLGTLANNQDNTGYTGEEQLDQLGLVHLNGRVYDPITGRMVSADPTVPEPEDLQAWNRYSYVLNSPLGYTDPTGFASQGDASVPTQRDPLGLSPQNDAPAEDKENTAKLLALGLIRKVTLTGSNIATYQVTQAGMALGAAASSGVEMKAAVVELVGRALSAAGSTAGMAAGAYVALGGATIAMLDKTQQLIPGSNTMAGPYGVFASTLDNGNNAGAALGVNSASLPPNGGDEEDPNKGDLKAVKEKKLEKDGIDAHAVKKDVVGSRGGQYNISVDSSTSEVYLTPVRRGAAEPVNTGLKYVDLAKTYPLRKP
jgi:RHS repeat-associated protein